MRGPSVTVIRPCARAAAISSGAKPPSGPMKRLSAGTAPRSASAARKPRSRSSSQGISTGPAAAAARQAAAKSSGARTGGTIPRPDCSAASRTIRCQRSSLPRAPPPASTPATVRAVRSGTIAATPISVAFWRV